MSTMDQQKARGMPRNFANTRASNANTNVSIEDANKKKNFLERLWDNVEDENEPNFCWQEPGFDGIVVKNKDAISKYESFRRTMYVWGFRKKRQSYKKKTEYWYHSKKNFRKDDSMNNFRLFKSILKKKAESTTTTRDSSTGGNQETEASGNGASDAFQATEGHTARTAFQATEGHPARTASVSCSSRTPATEQKSPSSSPTEAEQLMGLHKGLDMQWNDSNGDCMSMGSFPVFFPGSFPEGCSIDQIGDFQALSSSSTRVDGEAEHFPTIQFVQDPMSGKSKVDGRDGVAVSPGANHLSSGGGLQALHEQAAAHFWTIVNSFLFDHLSHVHHNHHRSCNKHVLCSSKSLISMSSAVEDLDCLLRLSRFASMPTCVHKPSHNQDDDTLFSIDAFIWNDFDKNVHLPEANHDALKEQKYWLKKKLQDLVSNHFVEEQVDRDRDCEARLAAIKALSYQLEGLRRISIGRRRQQQLAHHRGNNDDDDRNGDDDDDNINSDGGNGGSSGKGADNIDDNGGADMDQDDSGGDHVIGGGNSGCDILDGGSNISTIFGGSNGDGDIIGGVNGGDSGGDIIFTNGDDLGIIHEHGDDNNVSVGANSIGKVGENPSPGNLLQSGDYGKDVVDTQGRGADFVFVSACQQVLMEDRAATAVASCNTPLVGQFRTEEREVDDHEDLNDIGRGDDYVEDGDVDDDADNRMSVYMGTLKNNNDRSFVEGTQKTPTTQSPRKQHTDDENNSDNGNAGSSSHVGEYRDVSDTEYAGDDNSYVHDDASIDNEEDDDDNDDNDDQGGYDVTVLIKNSENATASAGMVCLSQSVASAEVSKDDVDVVLEGRMDAVQLGHDLDEDPPPETRTVRVPAPSPRLSRQMVGTTAGSSEIAAPMFREVTCKERTPRMQTPRRYSAVILREEGENVVLDLPPMKEPRAGCAAVAKDSMDAVQLSYHPPCKTPSPLLLPPFLEDDNLQGEVSREDTRNKDRHRKSPRWSFAAGLKYISGFVPQKSKLRLLGDDDASSVITTTTTTNTTTTATDLREEGVPKHSAQWKLVTSMRTSRKYVAAVTLHQEELIVALGGYVCGNVSLSSMESTSIKVVQDVPKTNNNLPPPSPQQWTDMPKMTRPRSSFGAAIVTTRRLPSNTAASSPCRHVVIAGGWCEGAPTESVEMWNLTSNESMELPPLQLKRSALAMTSLYSSGILRGFEDHYGDCGGRVYVVGGSDRGVWHDSVEWLDVGTEAQQGCNSKNARWRYLPSKMKRARRSCAVVMVQYPHSVVLGGKSSGVDGNGDASLSGVQLVVVGGAASGVFVTNTVECFDFGAGEWHDLPPMTTCRAGCAAVAIGCCIYVVGGVDEDLNSLATAEYFDFRTQRWTGLLPTMSVPRVGCAAVVVTDNDKNDEDNGNDEESLRHCIVVLGGGDFSNDTTHSSVEVLELWQQRIPAKSHHPI